MWTSWGKRKLRLAVDESRYQNLTLPAPQRQGAIAASRPKIRERMFSSLGANGKRDAITQKGEIQPAAWAIEALLGNGGPLRRRDWILLGYMGVLALSLGGVLAVAVRKESAVGLVGPSWPLLVLAVFAVVAERQNVSIGPRAALSVSFLPIVLAAVIYGPVGAILVSASSLLLDFGRPHARWIVWTSTRSLAAASAGFAASAIDGPSVQHSFVSLAAAVAVATVVEQFGDLFLGSITAAVRGVSLRDLRGAAWTLSLTAPSTPP